jgi:hypothetical protein
LIHQYKKEILKNPVNWFELQELLKTKNDYILPTNIQFSQYMLNIESEKILLYDSYWTSTIVPKNSEYIGYNNLIYCYYPKFMKSLPVSINKNNGEKHYVLLLKGNKNEFNMAREREYSEQY